MTNSIWKRAEAAPRRTVTAYPLLSLFDEMNRFWDETVPTRLSEGAQAVANFKPKFDVKETAEEVVLSGEFPGMSEKDISLTIKDNTLTLSGEKKFESERKDGEASHVERAYGSFTRQFQFGVELNEDAAEASMKNGVLTIRLPKSAKEIRGEKRLSIKAS
jgi:HSP20 family protein